MDLRTAHLRFDIGLLAGRLVGATDWLANEPDTRGLKVGYFGASTGGGAALVAAAERPDLVGAVVSRGGRPDLAGASLPHVRAPTLLIVGGRDGPVIEMNREALEQLRCEKRLEIVPGATHLFEEPGRSRRSRGSRSAGSDSISCRPAGRESPRPRRDRPRPGEERMPHRPATDRPVRPRKLYEGGET